MHLKGKEKYSYGYSIIGQCLGNFHHLFCCHAKVIHLCIKADILVNATALMSEAQQSGMLRKKNWLHGWSGARWMKWPPKTFFTGSCPAELKEKYNATITQIVLGFFTVQDFQDSCIYIQGLTVPGLLQSCGTLFRHSIYLLPSCVLSTSSSSRNSGFFYSYGYNFKTGRYL